MNFSVLLLILCLQIEIYARVGRNSPPRNIPKFDRQFLSRYIVQDLTEGVCTLTEDLVSLQQNCVDCMKNISSVLLTNDGSRMYIGAKSLLLSVNLDKCETIKNLPWMGAVTAMDCASQWECGNYITQIINLEETNLVACGTNYGNPEAIVMLPDLRMLEKILDVPRICSQSPSWGSSYLQTGNQIFAGVNEDSDQSAITKFEVNQYLQVSAQDAVTTDTQWLDHAEFVTSFESGDFVYFVMREQLAGSYTASVGRVCKSDPGYDNDQSSIDRQFLTFTKARMTCQMVISPSKREVLQFKVVTAATFNSVSRRLYATFTQYLDVDIGGYAVCSYDIADIDASFEGEYLTYNENGNEVSHPLSSPINCVAPYRSMYEAQSMYITSTTVSQMTEYPLYYELKKFTAVLSENVGDSTVLFIGTETGTVEKLVITPSQEIVLASEFVVAASHVPVRSMQFSSVNKRSLVISTEDSVSRFPVEQCGAHTELEMCVAIRDPHCCWCKTSHSCSHINDCTACVNDPEGGKVTTAFGRLTKYQWERPGECRPACNEVEATCTQGQMIVQFMQVYPKIQEVRQVTRNCTYVGPWSPYQPVSDNVTIADTGANEARFGVQDGRLFKILTAVFGSLFVVSMFIIVFLMFYKSSSSKRERGDMEKHKEMISRANSNNIIPDKPISYMPSKTDAQPMMAMTQQRMIMPQDLDKVTNSPYRSHMTAEDERLLQVQIRDPTENMYSDVYNTAHNAQTLPRNFGNSHTLDRASRQQQQQQQQPNYSRTLQRPNNNNRFYTQQDFSRYPPSMLS